MEAIIILVYLPAQKKSLFTSLRIATSSFLRLCACGCTHVYLQRRDDEISGRIVTIPTVSTVGLEVRFSVWRSYASARTRLWRHSMPNTALCGALY